VLGNHRYKSMIRPIGQRQRSFILMPSDTSHHPSAISRHRSKKPQQTLQQLRETIFWLSGFYCFAVVYESFGHADGTSRWAVKWGAAGHVGHLSSILS